MRGPDYQQDRKSAVEWAAKTMALKPVFLDTETTGLDDDAEVCDIAVIDYDGVVLFDSLIKPSSPIPDAASNMHGITNAMVADAPRFEQVLERLDKVLRGRAVVIYNVAYDTRLIAQSYPDPFPWWWMPRQDETLKSYSERSDRWYCAMNQYAQYAGDWNDYHRSYRWVKLSEAALQCGVVPTHGLHRARVDTELTRRIVRYMAAQMESD